MRHILQNPWRVRIGHWLYCVVLCLEVLPASAQYDSLLNQPFNQRFSDLRQLLEKYREAADSATLRAELDARAAFAKAKQNQQLLTEVELVKWKRFTAVKNADREKVEAAFENLAKIIRSLNDERLLATSEFYLADYYWDIQDFPQAMQHYEKAFEIAQKMNGQDYYLKQSIAYELGSKYYFLTDFATAIHYLAKSLEDVNPLDSLKPPISIYNTMGLAFMNQGNLDSSEVCFNQALVYAKLVDSKVWIGNLSGNLGHVAIMRGDLQRGKSLLQTDKEMSLKVGGRMSAAGAFLELAKLSFNDGDVELAERQLDSALVLMQGRMPFQRKRSLFPLLSKLYAYKGDWRQASMYIDSSLMVNDSLAKMDNAVQVLRLKQLVELQESKVEIAQREASIRKKTMQVYAMIAGLLVAVLAGGAVYRQKQKADLAKQRSDELLLNILPKDVADELKSTGASRARRFEETTVLFCDFKNFTQYSEGMPPEALVSILDDYFKAFDQVILELGLEKIKTVGDAYICACGLPVPDSSHAEKMVRCALKMQEIMKSNPAGWQLRIGIHSGPVVAGIVGIKKFAYDIWGDTVNTAARMEQHSEAGKVNISQATYELVKEKFRCAHRGKIDAKNKGELDMYYVEEGFG